MRQNKIVVNDITNGLNILIVGNCISKIKESKFLNKLYVTSPQETKGAINITFNTFSSLAEKCRALQIDLVVIEEEKWILEGISDILRANLINIFAPTTKWTNLAISNSFARSMTEKYNIEIPQIVTLPIDFPLIIRSDRIMKKVYNLEETIQFREILSNMSPEIHENTHLEEFIEGEKLVITSIFDGKFLLTLPTPKIDKALLTNYSKKLETMLITENAQFTGFINSEIIIRDDKIYNVGFNFNFPNFEFEPDILYVLWSAIYQKLGEISIEF